MEPGLSTDCLPVRPCQLGHEQVRVLHLDRGGDSSHHPVLDALGTTSFFNPDQLGDLGRAAMLSDQLGIFRGRFHTPH